MFLLVVKTIFLTAAHYMYERMEATGWEGTEINRKLDDE